MRSLPALPRIARSLGRALEDPLKFERGVCKLFDQVHPVKPQVTSLRSTSKALFKIVKGAFVPSTCRIGTGRALAQPCRTDPVTGRVDVCFCVGQNISGEVALGPERGQARHHARAREVGPDKGGPRLHPAGADVLVIHSMPLRSKYQAQYQQAPRWQR